MQRPSNKEIDRRLKDAQEALDNGCVSFSNQSKVVGELMELDIGDSSEVWPLIRCLLDEIEIDDYEGWYPPQVNYEPEGKGLELGQCFAQKKDVFKVFSGKRKVLLCLSS